MKSSKNQNKTKQDVSTLSKFYLYFFLAKKSYLPKEKSRKAFFKNHFILNPILLIMLFHWLTGWTVKMR